MTVTEDSFLRNVLERLHGEHDMETALSEAMIYMRNFFPVDELHMTYYDQESNLYKLIALATDKGVKKTNYLMPLNDRDIATLVDPDAPDVELCDMDKSLPAMVQYDRKMTGYWFIMLRLRKDDMLGTVAVFAKGPKPYSPEHVKLFSVLKMPFTSFLHDIVLNESLSLLKKNAINEDASIQRWKKCIAENEIIGAEGGLRQVLDMVRQVAQFDSAVILLGETGVGKEMVARLIHNLSPRRRGPYVPVNCGAIPETLIDSELFGHKKGAFTGATSTKKGVFELADKGTVFLDEVAELPLNAQVRMLRVLQEKTIQHVGGTTQMNVDVRIIAATHRNLDKMIHQGRFRSDLWFRLHVVTIMIPPLRERKEDIPLLVNHFLEKKSKQLNIPAPLPADGDAIAPMLAYDWPGNVRELENVVERALILSRGRPADFHSIVRGDESISLVQDDTTIEGPVKLDDVVRNHIRKILKLCKGKINGPGGAAEKLEINPATLRNRMNKLGIPYGKGKY